MIILLLWLSLSFYILVCFLIFILASIMSIEDCGSSETICTDCFSSNDCVRFKPRNSLFKLKIFPVSEHLGYISYVKWREMDILS